MRFNELPAGEEVSVSQIYFDVETQDPICATYSAFMKNE